jgi:hypothetical protein
MDATFNHELTYRFAISFHVGDDDDQDECGPERTIVKHFTIGLTPENYERLVYMDDHADVAWTNMWRATAWKFGQLGLCTAPSLGIFGFDTQEIDEPLEQDRIMRIWRWFHRHHGFETGPVETVTYTPDEYDALGDDLFKEIDAR